MQECAIVLGSYGFRESREKTGSTVRSVSKSWMPEAAVERLFLCLPGGSHSGGRDSHGYDDVFDVGIYSCL